LPVISRVGAAADMVIGTPQALSIAGGAALVAVLDYRLIFAIMAVGMLASAVYMWSGRGLTAVVAQESTAVEPSPV
jgi:hypothetical protein